MNEPKQQSTEVPEEAVEAMARGRYEYLWGKIWEKLPAGNQARLKSAARADLACAAPAIRKQGRQQFREAIYQELTGKHMPDHQLIAHLDSAEAALDNQGLPDG